MMYVIGFGIIVVAMLIFAIRQSAKIQGRVEENIKQLEKTNEAIRNGTKEVIKRKRDTVKGRLDEGTF